jgi:hypothetical protein
MLTRLSVEHRERKRDKRQIELKPSADAGLQQAGLPTFKAIVDEARKLQMPGVGHIPERNQTRIALSRWLSLAHNASNPSRGTSNAVFTFLTYSIDRRT